ncbi:MAG: YcxB family protein [Agathobacter sp.]|nr:YcxB family protein [Agathobacter sp.]
MKISFDIKLTAKDLFRFNMNQAYKGMQGFLSIALPILVFAYAVSTFGQVSIGSTLIYTGLGILFLIYVPVSLWLRANKIIKDENNALSKTLHYDFEEEIIRVSVGEESVEFKWENIFKMCTSGNLLLVYTNRINAYILPLEQVGMEYDKLSELAHKKLEKYRIKMYAQNK